MDRSVAATSSSEGTSPEVSWSEIPEDARSLALTVIDRHPVAADFVHWAVVDLPADSNGIREGESGSLTTGRELMNTSGTRGWHGPKPPPGSGPHPYEFTLYALSVERLDVSDRPSAKDLDDALAGHVVDSGTITGTYER